MRRQSEGIKAGKRSQKSAARKAKNASATREVGQKSKIDVVSKRRKARERKRIGGAGREVTKEESKTKN